MKRKILIVALSLVIAVAVFLGGCSEKLNQKPISTEYSDVISSNGGMSVVYGDYLYFINGFAGEAAANTFGEVVKGSVARVNLENGQPKGDAQVIVPKNVYGTDKTYGGITIYDNYIYYSTTSTDLNSSGDPKTGQGLIMRTKVDGSSSEVVTEFTDHTFVYKVVGGYLTYVRNNEIYRINLAAKKFEAEKAEESTILTGYQFGEDYLFYAINNEGDAADVIVKALPLAGGETKTILTSASQDDGDVKYTFALLSVIDNGSTVTLFYTKTDNGINTPKVGICAYTFDKTTMAFDIDNEIRFTHNATSAANLDYTKFYKAGNTYLGVNSKKVDIFNADGSKYMGKESIESLNFGAAVTVVEVEETDTAVYLWYINASVLYKIQVFEKTDGVYKTGEYNAQKVFSGAYDASYVTLEKIGSVLYYFNSKISNNAYYYAIPEDLSAVKDTAAGKILGIITESDIIAAF